MNWLKHHENKFDGEKYEEKEENKTYIVFPSKIIIGGSSLLLPSHIREDNWELAVVKLQLIIIPYRLLLMPVKHWIVYTVSTSGFELVQKESLEIYLYFFVPLIFKM